jgi:hypothetical protein
MIEATGTNGRATFDGVVVTLHRTGRLASMLLGTGTRTIPVRSMTGVKLKPAGLGTGRGFITFLVPGGAETPSDFGRQLVDAARDENSLVFNRRQQKAFEQLQRDVQAAVDSAADPTPPHGHPALKGAAGLAAVDNPLKSLRQLGQLLQAGVISQDEFDRAKARLLGRI